MINLAAAFLLLSGTASLTYQVVWVRLLGLSMGSTSASISTVLAAFFLGLALGSYLAERLTRNRIDSLSIYIALEALIGISGLALLPVLLNLDQIISLFPVLSGTLGMKFFLAMALLLLPTVCMGATFPVMASILIRRQGEVGIRMSQLYSLNTAGAVLGAALAGFYFVPTWGLDGAIYIAFSINACIVVVALLVNRRVPLPPLEPDIAKPSDQTDREAAPLRGRALVVLFATGFIAIAVEVGWTKYLSIFTGTTIYGFAAILTVFLIGIAAGSWAIKGKLQQMPRPELWMAMGLALLGLVLLFTRAGLTTIPPIYQAINHFPVAPWLRHWVKYLFVFVLLFPPTFIFGVLFPINLQLYCGNLQGVRARIGKAYSVNTLASILGSVCAGFYVIPEFGTDALLTAMALFTLALPLLFLPILQTSLLRATLVVVIILTVSANWVFPHINFKDLISSVQYDADAFKGKKPEYLFLKEGKAGVISMITYDGRNVKLQNNGLNESFLDLEDDLNSLLVETLLGLIPYMIHKDPKNAFVVGFGGGVTTRALSYSKLEQIHVVELEPAVVDAGRAIVKGEIDVLKDPRVTLTYNDARNTLLLEQTKYDIIAAQPSHPWLARASNVFTQEFFEIVKSRLNQDGIYGQWVNLFNMDSTTLKAIMKAFLNVFPHAVSFANLETGDFLLFGSPEKLIIDYEQIQGRMNEEKIKAALGFHEVYQAHDLLWFFALSQAEMLEATKTSIPNRDTNILSEVRLSRLYGDAKGHESPYKFLKANYQFDIKSYLKSDPNDSLVFLAEYFFKWNKPDIAKLVAKQLEPLNEVESRAIRYKALWRVWRDEEAESDYRQHSVWSDNTRYLHSIALLRQNRSKEARVEAQKAQTDKWRNIILARLDYEDKQWQSLLQRKPQSDEARKWQLLAVGRENIQRAGQAMQKIQERGEVELEIPQLELLVAYYASQNDNINLRDYSEKLSKEIASYRDRLSDMLENAIELEQKDRALRVLAEWQRFNPVVKDVRRLRAKVEKLQDKPPATADAVEEVKSITTDAAE